MVKKDPYVVWFRNVDKDDGVLVGGKGANLGEMVKAGFPVPNGFIVTSPAYFYFLKENKLENIIEKNLSGIDTSNSVLLQKASEIIKEEIINGIVPDDLVSEIIKHYHALDHPLKLAFKDPLVAVRSSATAEDLKTASFAGQQETFLNIQSEHSLVESIKKVWASLFEARAIFYRERNKIDHFKVGMAVPVQKMVESDVSGVMFTIDPVTNDKSKIIIEAIYGLGELIVQGAVTPDHYQVDKKNQQITLKNIVDQDIMLKKLGRENKKVKVSRSLFNKQKISDSQIKKLAEIGRQIEKHYYFPQDIEWAIENNRIYVVQTRPVTTVKSQISNLKSQKKKLEIGKLALSKFLVERWKLEILLRGDSASPGIATGPVRIIKNPSEINQIQNGDVLVAPQTNPDYVAAMKKAVAIVTERGGRTSHAAIVSRELGIPAIVGVESATRLLQTGLVVTVNGTTGEIFKGGIQNSEFRMGALREQNSELGKQRIKTKTKLYVNLAEPDRAYEISQMDVDGVGLLRAEFMIGQIGIHPKKLIDEGKKRIFVDAISEKLKMFCEAFNPRPVIYRTSDLKTNEYRNLGGGSKYETAEENPMLGFRGAQRYINDQEIFELELAAVKRVRKIMKFKNLWLMIPFVRTIEELVGVKKILTSFSLNRSSTFKLWLMVETPGNVIQLPEFIKIGIDGVSIGSNDLTMLMLGVDRDNNKVAKLYDERNSAVLWAIEQVIKTCKNHKITSSICGQLPSVYPEYIENLVKWGITSISVSPDAIDDAREIIKEVEKKKKE